MEINISLEMHEERNGNSIIPKNHTDDQKTYTFKKVIPFVCYHCKVTNTYVLPL